ncbi:hypothetical protein C0Q70_14355 [Pomacea canaliculata]|uniref:Uncharacterized protein n=2 Tax=Pomacea canaliculata TaxID=400727 RepID=A0A2T7NZT1_POMCA|nr:hypothetical protein C0Q70_14355 [Pomacea canaliculata]
MAEVLRRLAHPNVTGENGGMEPLDKEFYGAFTSRSELPRGQCLIAIIWEAARPSATFEELLVLLDDMQDDLEDMQDDLLTLMEDMMYRDLFEEEYYYEDDEFYDYNENLYDESFPSVADPDYYQHDVPDFDNDDDFDEGAREEADADNDRLLLFAPWMH